ncbi:MAG: hypothetical protein JWM37_729 [Candidatus Saccharibacteria bacterium]|nr:hypothetical protein [Candidatus Saccharibacteria bacterium]
MTARKYRWSKTYESAEEELTALLAHKNITAERWSIDAFENRVAEPAPSGRRLWCAEGSTTVIVNEKNYSLQPGDTLDIAAPGAYQAIAGLNGCSCYEIVTES